MSLDRRVSKIDQSVVPKKIRIRSQNHPRLTDLFPEAGIGFDGFLVRASSPAIDPENQWKRSVEPLLQQVADLGIKARVVRNSPFQNAFLDVGIEVHDASKEDVGFDDQFFPGPTLVQLVERLFPTLQLLTETADLPFREFDVGCGLSA